MTTLFVLFLLWAAPAPLSLAQVKAEPNPEHRARAAIDYAAAAERHAEADYAKGDLAAVSTELKNVSDSFDTAQESFAETHKTPGRNPGPYKYAELHSRQLLIRLGDLEQRMDSGDRTLVADVKAKIQGMHDAWFEGIMERTK